MRQDHWNKQHASDQEVQNLFNLLKQMLVWEPAERISAKEALDWTNRHGILVPTPTSSAGTKNKLVSPIIGPEVDFGKRRRKSVR
jgi:hypothetical protein